MKHSLDIEMVNEILAHLDAKIDEILAQVKKSKTADKFCTHSYHYGVVAGLQEAMKNFSHTEKFCGEEDQDE